MVICTTIISVVTGAALFPVIHIFQLYTEQELEYFYQCLAKNRKKIVINKITKDVDIEDLVQALPEAVSYLTKKGIRCLRCGEPIWGTLETAAQEKGFDKKDIENFVEDLNKLLKQN